MYLYGFYMFKNPELELPICLSSVVAIAWYCRCHRLAPSPKRPFMAYLLKHKPALQASFYLLLNNLSVLVFVYCVIFSLLIMNLMHIMVLVVMVVAQFQPQFYHKHIHWLVAYADFIVLSKYIYTLADQSNTVKVVNIIFGFWSENYDPQATHEYWRYQVPFPLWVFLILVTMQFRVNQTIGCCPETLDKESSEAGDRIAGQYPWLRKVYSGFMIALNHSIILITFLLFLLTIYLIRRSFLNGGSLVITFVLLGFYLNRGLDCMMRYWRVLQLYQAIVLLLVLMVQFFYYIAQSQIEQQVPSVLQSYWVSLDGNQQALWHYFGFYTFDDPIWKPFLPYVILFFASIIVEPRFRQKLAIESAEESCPEQMKYRMTFLLWKLEWAWPGLTFVAVRFNYVMLTFILFCALYYSIALIWMVWLFIFMLQTWYLQRKHMQYQKAQVRRFADSPCLDGIERETFNASEKRY